MSSQQRTNPLISVIIPTYKDAEYLEGAIDSIRDQTYDNVEIVIIDSSGVSWIEKLAANHEEIRYVNTTPKGPAAARNRGIDISSGDLIAFLDADDRWHPDKLERQVEAITDGADIVYSDQEVVSH